jgi:hypothetical protein
MLERITLALHTRYIKPARRRASGARSFAAASAERGAGAAQAFRLRNSISQKALRQ